MKKFTGTTLRRQFDHGEPLLFEINEKDEPNISGHYTVITEICDNSDCPCREVGLILHRFHPGPPGNGTIDPEVAIRFDLNVDTDVFEMKDNAAALSAQEVAKLAAQLSPAVPRFKERRKRVKGRGQQDEWREQRWEGFERGLLAPYFEAFPSSWELFCEHEGKLYWLIDNWCLNSDCDCRKVTVRVVSEGSKDVGTLHVAFDTWKIVSAEGPPALAEIWREFLAFPESRSVLTARMKNMKKVARKLPAHLAAKPRAIGPEL